MKRKILAMLLCICTLLPLGGMFSYAEGVELKFERYFTGSESDWEIYGNNTYLVLAVSGDEVANLASSVDNDTYTWYLKTNGDRYQVNPTSYSMLDGGTRIALRFPTFSNGFCPSVNPIDKEGDAGIYYNIDIIATDKDGKTVYYGKATGLHSEITDPEIPGVGILNGSRLDNGFRNTDTATELLFTIKENNMQQFYTDRDKYTWRFTYASADTFGSFEAKPTSCNAGSQLLTFEPCLAEPPFIPQKNVKYFINLELWQDGELKYFAGSTIYGYTLKNAVAMVPSKKYDITFKVGTQTQTKSYYEGQIPQCDLEINLPSTASHDFVFTGWYPALAKVTGPVTYTAKYEKVLRKYEVTFVTEKETVTKLVPYGEKPAYEGDLSPVKMSNGKVKIFTGWDQQILEVSGNKTYHALYREADLSEVPVLKTQSKHLYRGTAAEFIIMLSGGRNITSFSFDLSYDQSRFAIKEMTALVEGVKIDGTKISYSGNLTPSDTQLVKLVLKAKEDGAYGKTTISFDQPLMQSKDTSLGCICENAAATLSGILSGDVNEDCAVDTSDANALIAMLLQNKSSKDLSDTNHDGVFDLKDAVRVCRYVQGTTDDIWSSYDDETYTVTYVAEVGGKIEGQKTQTVTRKQSTEAVLALSYSYGYAFNGWSDGRSGYKRQDTGIEEDLTLTAKFEKQEIDLAIPNLYVDTLGQESIDSKTEYRMGMLTIQGAEDEKYNVNNLPLEIKGRGNYSWDALKNIKPSYRVRLANKESLLGIGAEDRDWVLLSVYNDVTMLRNYATGRLGELFNNLPHSVKGRYVVLHLNGEYCGVYLLCERIEASRLGLDDETMNINKDYLLEMDARAAGEGVEGLDWFTVNGGQQPFVIKSQVNGKQDTQYIQSEVTKLNTVMLSGDQKKISVIVDIPSLVDSYIIEEFGKDRDVGFASFYIMKKASGKFYFTSPWDFDLGWGNDSAYPSTDGLVSNGSNGNAWFRVLVEQEWFRELVKERMEELDERVKAIAWEMEATSKALAPVAREDEAHFGTLGHCLMEEPEAVYSLQSYEEHVAYFLEWYNNRWQWLCDYFGVT